MRESTYINGFLTLKRGDTQTGLTCETSVVHHNNNFYIVNTLLPEEFKHFVREKVAENEKMFVMKRKMVVDAKPAFIELFRKSNMIASIV